MQSEPTYDFAANSHTLKYHSPQELFSSFQVPTEDTKSKTVMLESYRREAIKNAESPINTNTPFMSNLVINNPKSSSVINRIPPVLTDGLRKVPGEPFYYINGAKRLCQPPVFQQPHPAGFYAVPNPYAALNYGHMANTWKPAPNIYSNKKYVEKPVDTLKSKKFTLVQRQMASNQIPLCLVQDTNGKLHQLVYTVPSSAYKKYVKEAAKGNTVKLEQIKNISKGDTSQKSEVDTKQVEGKEIITIKSDDNALQNVNMKKEISVINLVDDDNTEDSDSNKTQSTDQINGTESPTTFAPADSTTLSPSIKLLNDDSLNSNRTEMTERKDKPPEEQNIKNSMVKHHFPTNNHPALIPAANNHESIIDASMNSVESIDTLFSDDSSIYTDNSVHSDEMLFTFGNTTDHDTDMDTHETLGTMNLESKALHKEPQDLTIGPIATIDDIILRHKKDLIPKSEVENLLMTLKRKFEEKEIENERNLKKIKTNEEIVPEPYGADFFEQFSPNYSSDDDNLLLQSRLTRHLTQDSFYKPRDTLLNANSTFPHTSLATNSILHQSNDLVFSNSQAQTSSFINNTSLLQSRESMIQSRDRRLRDPKRISSIDSTFSYSSLDSPDNSPLLVTEGFNDILGNEANNMENETGILKDTLCCNLATSDLLKNDLKELNNTLNHNLTNTQSTKLLEVDNNTRLLFSPCHSTNKNNPSLLTSTKLDTADSSNYFINYQMNEMDLFDHFWDEIENS